MPYIYRAEPVRRQASVDSEFSKLSLYMKQSGHRDSRRHMSSVALCFAREEKTLRDVYDRFSTSAQFGLPFEPESPELPYMLVGALGEFHLSLIATNKATVFGNKVFLKWIALYNQRMGERLVYAGKPHPVFSDLKQAVKVVLNPAALERHGRAIVSVANQINKPVAPNTTSR